MFIIFGLKSMIKQLMNLVYDFLHLKCIIKQLLETGFCDMQNYQCLGKSYQITLISTLIILHITKTCFQ